MHRIEAYVTLGIIFIVIISVLYLPILFKLKKKGISPLRQLGYLGLFCSIFLIVYATILFMLITFTPETHTLNLVPFNFTDFNQFVVEKVPNIMLFIPLGFFMPIVFKNTRKFYKTVLISFAITFSIEFFQYFIGRSSDIDDVITNLLGAIIGYAIFFITNMIFKKQKWWNKLLKNMNEK